MYIKKYTQACTAKRGRCGGFTLLEILLVVGIISVLAGIVIIAINPGRQLAQVRNTERRSDIKQVYNAVQQFYIDKKYYPASTTDYVTSLVEICDTGTSTYPSSLPCNNLVDLSQLVPTYITAIPKDPQGPVLSFLDQVITPAYAASGGTGYWLGKTSTGRIVLNSERAELGAVIAIGTSTATTTTSLIPTDGLVSYWSFNDAGVGTAFDLIGDNNGAVNGAIATTSVKGIANKAYYFDGSDDYVNFGTPTSLQLTNKFALCAWIYPKTSTSINTIGGYHYGGVVKGYVIQRTGSSITFYVQNGVAWATASGTITQNSWNFICGNINFTTNYAEMWVNGILNSTSTTQPSAISFTSASFNIGATGGTPASFFNGAIDEVRIYNRSLSLGEVMTIYNEEKP